MKDQTKATVLYLIFLALCLVVIVLSLVHSEWFSWNTYFWFGVYFCIAGAIYSKKVKKDKDE